MKSYELVAQIATAENKDKVVEIPSIKEIEDWNDLIEGLKVMIKCSYAFIKECKNCNLEDELPSMQELNVAGTNIQFATAQMLATYTAYYDLCNKIVEHNKAIEEQKA